MELLESKGAPDSFVFCDVKLVISGLEVYHFDGYFRLVVCERAKFSVAAFLFLGLVSPTKLGFVSAGVVKLFDFIVRVTALFVPASPIPTEHVTVGLEVGSAAVTFGVETEAAIALMQFFITNKIHLMLQGVVLKVLRSNRKNSPLEKD